MYRLLTYLYLAKIQVVANVCLGSRTSCLLKRFECLFECKHFVRGFRVIFITRFHELY